MKPVKNGCEWSSVLCIDISGSIPDYLKKKGAASYIEGSEAAIYCVRHGRAPGN